METKNFNKAVGRNIERFPENFCFQLTKEEFDDLRFQIRTSNNRGGRRYLPYAFAEQESRKEMFRYFFLDRFQYGKRAFEPSENI